MQDERGRFVVTAGQDDQAPHPGFRDVALSQSARKIVQLRLFGIRFSGFEGPADGVYFTGVAGAAGSSEHRLATVAERRALPGRFRRNRETVSAAGELFRRAISNVIPASRFARPGMTALDVIS